MWRSTFRKLSLGILPIYFSSIVTAQAAELAVNNVTILPGTTADVVVSGSIAGESAFGASILLQIVPQPGTTGMLEFTGAQLDIVQLGDPWPAAGTFSAFDTNLTASSTLSGIVDDNSTFLASATTFSGELASFRVVASADAQGVWDVLLSTSMGDSSWQGLPTTLVAGTISVCDNDGTCEVGENCENCPTDCSCDDGVACTIDTCSGGVCANTPNNASCPDNGIFCDGDEVCNPTLGCVSTGNPCSLRICDEATNSCKKIVLERRRAIE